MAIAAAFAEGQRVAVVPAVFDYWHVGSVPVYVIPDGSGDWMTTSPALYDAHIARANRESGGKLIQVAQMMKFWRGCRNPAIPLSSFHIEIILASEQICKGLKSYSQCMLEILRSLARRKCRAIQDPYDIAGNIPAVKTFGQREWAS